MQKVKPTNLALYYFLLAVFFTIGWSIVQAQNLVQNGGFESGLTSGWSHSASGGAVASFSLETAQPYAGTRALKNVITKVVTDIWRVQTLGPTFTNLGTGRATSISFRARAAKADTRVRFVMQTNNYIIQDFTLSTSWTYYTWNHTTVEASPRLRIQYPSVGTVWLDGISVVTHDASGIAIALNPMVRNQTMDGIGGSIAFNLTTDYVNLSATRKNEIENLLYVDCGIDIVRLRTGNSDALNNELAMRAQRNGAKSLLTSWSPPAALKSNNSIVSGTLRIISGKYDYTGFADWWHARLSASNWTHDFISIQNEPSYDPGNKETCRLFSNETFPATTTGSASYKLALEAVYNRIKNEPKIPQFIGVDAETHSAFKTIAPTVSGFSYVNRQGFHNYGTNDFAGVKARYNGKRGWMTEWGKDASTADPIGIKEDWMLLATNIHETLVGADASAYLAWRMVHGNNTGQVWAMIGLESGQYKVQKSFYVVKHYAKEISSGDQRFEVNRTGTNNNISVSGFIDPTGKKLTLIALNNGSSAADVSLRLNGLPVVSTAAFQTKEVDTNTAGFFTNPYQALGSFNPTQSQSLPAESITTYVISLSETLNPYDPELLEVDWIQHYSDRVYLGMPIQPGQKFILWKSTDLAAGSWQKVTNAVFVESGDQLIITDPSPGTGRGFYRVQRDTGF
jgi:glucuronoarabinoxylan endo-1,4-beta-xylanase